MPLGATATVADIRGVNTKGRATIDKACAVNVHTSSSMDSVNLWVPAAYKLPPHSHRTIDRHEIVSNWRQIRALTPDPM